MDMNAGILLTNDHLKFYIVLLELAVVQLFICWNLRFD